ncbi:tyrosine-type recombinase/integrase [Cereibacter johrii]|uniref:tyrosine-type recombinase/integrase n=1 Tax=Cereibacter johrii TaxID=445629 RepID=UPI002B259305|nr:integrase arm-type DNA-binding domain-containing protein [Cereibacter johrii]MEA5162056.1 integrase arm-type DNA-binding domain-containing protein [Cereibacter johrii]
MRRMLSGCEGKSLARKAEFVASRNMVFQGSAACPVGLAEGLERGGMARGKNALTAVSIRQSGVGRLIDGGGLMVDKTGEATGKWIWRYSFAGKRRDMGLGPWPDVSLADARRARDRWAAVLLSGLDPISERDRIRAAERAEMDKRDPTLEELALITFEARKPSLRGEGTRGRWFSPIKKHVLPKLGARRVSSIHQTDIQRALAPIWRTKTATAEKCIGRLAIIFHHGKLAGLPCDPFTVEAAKHLLGDLRRDVVPIPATPWQEIPVLFETLAGHSGSSFDCARWLILTAVRSDAARGARFSEIEGDVWTVPVDRVKGREGKAQPFRVPLSTAALAMVEDMRAQAENDYLFPSQRRGKHLTAEAVEKAMRTVGAAGKPHGLRTSFRTWVQDHEAASYDVAETALGHVVGGRIERSYARSDLLDQRRVLMEKWGAYVTGAAAQVIALPRRA